MKTKESILLEWLLNLGIFEKELIKEQLNINSDIFNEPEKVQKILVMLLENGSVACCLMNMSTIVPEIEKILNTKSKIDAISNFEKFFQVAKNNFSIELKKCEFEKIYVYGNLYLNDILDVFLKLPFLLQKSKL